MRRLIILACMVGLGLGADVGLPTAVASGPGGTEFFTLIIEGTSTAKRTFTETGETGPCKIKVNGTLTETATYQRGRGVTVAANRTSAGTLVFRSGTEFNRDITTRVHIVRRATGSVSFKPIVPQFLSLCKRFKGTRDLSKAGCPEKQTFTADWGLKSEGGGFALRQADVLSGPGHGLKHGPGSCGYNTYTAGFLEMAHEYPDIPEVGFVPFPIAELFGHKHAFLVHMTSGEVIDPPRTVGTPPLTGKANDSGRTDILLRFIRNS
jgi:hypothetical protein